MPSAGDECQVSLGERASRSTSVGAVNRTVTGPPRRGASDMRAAQGLRGQNPCGRVRSVYMIKKLECAQRTPNPLRGARRDCRLIPRHTPTSGDTVVHQVFRCRASSWRKIDRVGNALFAPPAHHMILRTRTATTCVGTSRRLCRRRSCGGARCDGDAHGGTARAAGPVSVCASRTLARCGPHVKNDTDAVTT